MISAQIKYYVAELCKNLKTTGTTIFVYNVQLFWFITFIDTYR